MAMQDRAKANHDLGKDAMINHVRDKDAMINHVLDKGSMFFFVTPSVRNHGILAKSMFPLAALDVFLVLHFDLIPQTLLH